MKLLLVFALLFMAGCSQDYGATEYDHRDASPAGSTVHPAEASGYMDSTDPQAFPPTPGDSDNPWR